jgi:hypothetical protein
MCVVVCVIVYLFLKIHAHYGRWKYLFLSLILLFESQNRMTGDENIYTHACKYKSIFYILLEFLTTRIFFYGGRICTRKRNEISDI